MKLIVGLGNPGVKYEKTRHNLGWRVIDELNQDMAFNDWQIKIQFQTQICFGLLKKEKIILAKPQTFMNNSGVAVKLIANYYKIPAENISAIHDEIDLPLGEIKIQDNRGAAGHNGIKSIIKELKSKSFIRFRIGIRPKYKRSIETEKFVLESFTSQEEKTVEKTIKKAVQLITSSLKKRRDLI